MTFRRISVVVAAFAVVLTSSAEAQTRLRYRALGDTLSYAMTDSTVNTVVTPMGEMPTNIHAASAVKLSSAAAGDSLQVTARLTDMKVGMSAMGQQMDMPMPAGWDAVNTFTVSSLGISLAGAVADGADGGAAASNTVQRLFLPLPEGAVAVGESWSDTATMVLDSAVTGEIRAASTGSWVSDTTVDGRQLRVLRYVTEYTISMQGEMQGMQMTQNMSGRSETIAHFDPALGVNVFVQEAGQMKGKVNIAAAGMTDVDSSVTIKRTARLQR